MKAKALIKRFKNDPNALLSELLAGLISAKISLQDARAMKQHLRSTITELNQEQASQVDSLLSSMAWYFENTHRTPILPAAVSAPAAVNLDLPIPASNIERIDRSDQPQAMLPVRTHSEPTLAADLHQVANAILDQHVKQARLDFLNQLEAKHYRPKKVGFFNPNPKWQANFNPTSIRNAKRFEIWQKHLDEAVSKANANEIPDLIDIIRPFSGRVGSTSIFTFNKTALKVPLHDNKDHPLLDIWMKMVRKDLTTDPTLTTFMKYSFNQSLLHMGYNLAVLETDSLVKLLPLKEFIEHYSQPEESHVVTMANENTLRFTSRLALHDKAKRKILTVYSTIEVSKVSAEHSPYFRAKLTELNVRAYSNRAKLIAPSAYNRYRMEKYLKNLRIEKSRSPEANTQQLTAQSHHAIRKALEPFADFLHPYKFKQILQLLINEAKRSAQINSEVTTAIEIKTKALIAEHISFYLKSNLPFTDKNAILDSRFYKTDYEALENFYLDKLSLAEKISMSEVARSVYAPGNWLSFDELNDLITEEILGNKNNNKSYRGRLDAHREALAKKAYDAEKSVFRNLVHASSTEEKQQLIRLIDNFSKFDFFNVPFNATVLKNLLLPQLAIQSILTLHFKNKHQMEPNKAADLAKQLSRALFAGLEVAKTALEDRDLNRILNQLNLLNQHGNLHSTIVSIADQFIAEPDTLETVVRQTLIRQLIAKTKASYEAQLGKPTLRNLHPAEAKKVAFRDTVGAYLVNNPNHLAALIINVNTALDKTKPLDLTLNAMEEACKNAIAAHDELLLTQLIREALAPIPVADEAIVNCRNLINTIPFTPFRVSGWPANVTSLKVIVNELHKNNLLSKPDLTVDEVYFVRKLVYEQALNDLLQTDLAELRKHGSRLGTTYKQLVLVELDKDENHVKHVTKALAEKLATASNDWIAFSDLRKELQSYIINKEFKFTQHYRATIKTDVDNTWQVQLPLHRQQLSIAKTINLSSRMLFELSEITLGAAHAQTKAAKLLYDATQPEQVLSKVQADSAKGFDNYLSEQRQQLKQFLKGHPPITRENHDLRTLAFDSLVHIRIYQRKQMVDPLLPQLLEILNPRKITVARSFFSWLFRGFRFTDTENNMNWYERVNEELIGIREGGSLVNHLINLRNLLDIGRREAQTRNLVAKSQLTNQLEALENFIKAIEKNDVKKIKQTLIQHMLTPSPGQAGQNNLELQKQRLQDKLKEHKSPAVQRLLANHASNETRLFNEANTASKLKKATKAISTAIVADRYRGNRNEPG